MNKFNMAVKKTTSFSHMGTIGDVWASLAAIKEYHKKTGKKAILYLINGQKAEYHSPSVIHPTTDPITGEQVMLNERVINMMIPLLKAQPYIEDAKIQGSEIISVDLNMIRNTFVNQPHGMLSRWYFYVFPDMACDLSKKYIEVPETDIDWAKGKIIVGRSERYLNPLISYSFMKQYGDDVLFSGTDIEFMLFNMRFGLNVKRLDVTNFLELAQALKQAKCLVSNQTQIFQIAEGLKSPRIVELCSFAPNVVPIGEHAYDFYAQLALEYYVKILWEKQENHEHFPLYVE